MKLSEQIIKIRMDNNLTQEQFAEDLFVTRQAVSKWERGISIPDIETLKRISIMYKVSLNVLLGLIENNKSEEKKPLAYKSLKVLYSSIKILVPCFFLFIVLIIATFTNRQIIMLRFYLLLAIVGVIISIVVIVVNLKKPKLLVEYNDYGLFINYPKKVFIKYEDIVEIKFWHSKAAREILASYGTLTIITKEKTINIHSVDKANEVENEIILLKEKNTFSEIK